VTEIVTTQAQIARVRAKLRAASDEGSRRYYELCLIGWERWLTKLKSEHSDPNETARYSGMPPMASVSDVASR